jgi:hypothetical protein
MIEPKLNAKKLILLGLRTNNGQTDGQCRIKNGIFPPSKFIAL